MKQWEIWEFPFPEGQVHPFVIISSDTICGHDPLATVNGLLCTSLRAGREPRLFEAVLDASDGLDRRTAVNCVRIHDLRKAERGQKRGEVLHARRPEIKKKVLRLLEW